MKAAVYDKFWHSMGGGERHAGMIAQALRQSGHDVDLIGHRRVSVPELSSRLALDLSGISLRVLPDLGDQAMSEVSAEYDLFVNGSYMSRVVARSQRSAYLCYFPTPFDHDLHAAHRALIRLVGARLGNPDQPETPGSFYYGSGWFPPEGGRRRQWAWSNGDGNLMFGPGGPAELRLDLGRPGATGPAALTVATDNAQHPIEVSPAFTPHSVIVPASDRPRTVRFVSDTFTPGGTDTRQLGIAASRLRVGRTRLSARQWVTLRYPWLLRNPRDLDFLRSYDVVLANSTYTQGWIERLWNIPSEILFPPIEISHSRPRADRDQVILSVGRFFSPNHGHSKRQLEMVQMFRQLVHTGQLPGWRFVVIGGCEEHQRGYLDAVRNAAAGLPVEIHPNAARDLVESHMASASIFWSATGLGASTNRRPWMNEHFGMTTAEAMAAGCVPIVIDRAGQREIVREAVDGFRWADAATLRIRTVQVASDESLRRRLASSAMQRAQEFSDDAFVARWHKLATSHDLIRA